MRVLIAPDSFAGTLTATQAAEAMADGWRRSAPDDHLDLRPLSDGGAGFIDVLHQAMGGDLVVLGVSDPLGREVPASILVVEREGVRTAYLEAAAACGLHLLGANERNPALTSTYGVGQLLDAAISCNASRVVVSVEGSGTNDGGAGLLAALGAGPREQLARGGLALREATNEALAGLETARQRCAGVDLVLATDAELPLLGLQGASASDAPRKGASPQVAQDLEGALGRFTEVVARTSPAPRDLLLGAPRRLDREAGAGAGGGLGYALFLLGAHRVSAVQEVLDAVDLDTHLTGADLVVTGEGRMDWQSLQGKVVPGVAERALAQAIPVVVLAGEILLGRRELMNLGISGAYAVADGPDQAAAAMADPVATLAARAERAARTWSPQR